MTTNRGFSLVELLVYMSILVFLTIVIINTLASTNRLATRQNNSAGIARTVTIIFDRFDRGVRSADSAAVSNGVLVLDGVAFDPASLVETGLTLSNLSYNLSQSTSSSKVSASFALNGESFYSTTVLRHKK